MFDIPFFRFAVPAAILYIFYYMLIVNPPIEQDEHHKGLSPGDVRTLRFKGAALMEAKQFDEAEDPYGQLHKEFPDNAFYSAEMAKIRHAQQRYEEEAALWEDYMQHSPTPVEGCPQIGIAYRHAGNSAKALESLKHCWEYERTNTDMILFYALELEHQDRKKEAYDLYVKGHQISPRYTDLTTGLARTELSMGRTAEARRLILEALAHSPDSVDALLEAGIIMSRTGDVEAARRYLQHGIEVSPNYEDMRIALAALEVQPGRKTGSRAKPSPAARARSHA